MHRYYYVYLWGIDSTPTRSNTLLLEKAETHDIGMLLMVTLCITCTCLQRFEAGGSVVAGTSSSLHRSSQSQQANACTAAPSTPSVAAAGGTLPAAAASGSGASAASTSGSSAAAPEAAEGIPGTRGGRMAGRSERLTRARQGNRLADPERLCDPREQMGLFYQGRKHLS
ncbi:unnamed protein product [Closterium sp. NIES-54]